MSRQGTAVVRLLFLVLIATFMVAVGSQVDAQDVGNRSNAREDLLFPPSTIIGNQEAPEDGKPPLIGGVPSEAPPFADPSSPSRDQTGIDFQSSPDAPTITIWTESTQKAGANGDPQKWVNVVGTVTPKPSTLTYSLNGGPSVSLRTGPDTRRLARSGDFNIELDYTKLNQGPNQVIIVAKDSQGNQSQASVTVNYQGGGVTWITPKPYTYDWATASRIDDLAQVVDGDWQLDKSHGVVRPVVLAYDRLIGIGDLSWRDYTVTVPVKFTSIDEAGYLFPSNGPLVGIIVRWQGHTDTGRVAPVEGWGRLGALALYHWSRAKVDDGYAYSEALRMYRYLGKPDQIITKDRKLNMGTIYNFKVSVQSTGNANPPAIYRFKVWNASLPEPSAWDIEAPGFAGEPASGGLLLVAHHVNAEFGKVTVNLNSTLPPPTLTVNTTGSGSGNVNLLPSRPSNTYRFGEEVRLTAVPGNESYFAGWQGSLSGNTNPEWLEMFSNKTVTAVFTDVNAGSLVSDDFSGCTLNSRWRYIDPLGHSTLTMTGSRMEISVPSGTSHDIWTNNRNAPRIMQQISGGDFELDVKFDSPMNSRYQLQGVLAEADSQNFLRYNFQHDGTSYRIAAYTVVGNVATTRIDQAIGINPPMYLRTNRTGNTWTLSYSGDGQNWTQATQFTHNLEATSLGVFVGNASPNPAMVGRVDYFFNTASPIMPQGSGPKLTITTAGAGSGAVARNPQRDNYACNEQVTLEAVAAPGSLFTGWGGDLGGINNPVTINMTRDMAIVANFSEEVKYHTLNISTEGEGTVEVTPPGSQFPYGTQVSLLASPAAGYKFAGWRGAISGNANPYTLYIDGDKSVIATFIADPVPTESFIFLPTVITLSID